MMSDLDIQTLRQQLVETVQGPQKGNWALIVVKMTDSEVRTELARRATPNRYIDEELTYNGQEMDYEVKEAVTEAKITRPQVQQEQRLIDPSEIVGAFSH
jgi:hypothetical protein